MGGIVEAPVERNFGDGLGLQPRVAQIFAAALQALRANPVGDSSTLLREDAVDVPDGDS